MIAVFAICLGLLAACGDDGDDNNDGEATTVSTPADTATAYFAAIRANDKDAALDLACGVQHDRLTELAKVRTIVVEDNDIVDTDVDAKESAATVTLTMAKDYPADSLRLELKKDESWKVCDLTIVM